MRSLLFRARTPRPCPDPSSPHNQEPLTATTPPHFHQPPSCLRITRRWSRGVPRLSGSWKRLCPRGRRRRRSCRRWRSSRARRCGGSVGGPMRRWHRQQRPLVYLHRAARQKKWTRSSRRHHQRTRKIQRHLNEEFELFSSDFSMEVAAFLQHANRSLLQILSPCFNLRTVHVTTQSRIVSGRVNGLILHSALNRKCVCVWQMFDAHVWRGPFPLLFLQWCCMFIFFLRPPEGKKIFCLSVEHFCCVFLKKTFSR